MFNFNINWSNLVWWNTPQAKRDNTNLSWLDVLISPVRDLHATFLQYRNDTIYKVRFTGQIIYLEKFLNDKYDQINRGIYIDNVANISKPYLYNKSEQRPVRHLYNKWDATVTYVAGEFAVYGQKVYIAMTGTTNQLPPTNPTVWKIYANKFYLKNITEYQLQYDFIVMVPSSVVFDQNEMKGYVNYYKLAGKRYTIQTY
jgi:hypothetical protein